MHLGQMLGERQAEPRALIFSAERALDLTERRERFREIARVYPNSIVADGDSRAPAPPKGSHAHEAAFGREFHRVGKKIEQDLPHPATVGVNARQAAGDMYGQLNLRSLGLLFHQIDARLNRSRKIDFLFIELQL